MIKKFIPSVVILLFFVITSSPTAANPGIIGNWVQGEKEITDGFNNYFTFKADGTFEFRVSAAMIEPREGTYTVRGNTITFTVPEADSIFYEVYGRTAIIVSVSANQIVLGFVQADGSRREVLYTRL